MKVIYINGIENSKPYAEQTRAMLEVRTGYKVELFYEPYGILAPELPDRWLKGTEETIKQLRAKLLGAGNNVCVIAHSYGCYLTYEAVKGMKPKERGRISLYGFGGVAHFPKGYGYRVMNFLDEKDRIAELGKYLKGKVSELPTNAPLTILKDTALSPFDQHAFRKKYLDQAVKTLTRLKWQARVPYIAVLALLVLFHSPITRNLAQFGRWTKQKLISLR